MSMQRLLNLTSSITSGRSLGALTALATVAMPTIAHAASPLDGTVTVGTSSTTQLGNTYTTNQSTNVAVSTYNTGINLPAGFTWNINQPGSRSVSGHIVTPNAGDPSKIGGMINSNGIVGIFDSNGVIYQGGSSVNVAGLITSTSRDVSITTNALTGDVDAVEMSNFGDGAIIVESGATISVAEAGLAAFVGPEFTNDGTIVANLGTVLIGVGEKVTIDPHGDGLIEIVAGDAIEEALIRNNGLISAEGGQIIIDAKTANDSVKSIINVNGVVDASSATVKGGKIVLSAGTRGDISVGNQAKVKADGTSGGTIEMTGDIVNVGSRAEVTADAIPPVVEPPVDAVAVEAADGDASGMGGNIKVIATRRSTISGLVSANGTGGSVTWSAGDFATLRAAGPVNGETAGRVRAESVHVDTPLANLDGDIESNNITGTAQTVNVISSLNGAEIQDAVGIAAAGATVNIEAGTYVENLVIDKEGLKLAGKDGAILQAETAEDLIKVTAGNVNIDPIVFDGMGLANYGINASGAGALGLVIDGNTFRNFNVAGVRIDANGAGTGEIKNNTFEGSSTRGVEIQGLNGGYTLNITDNTFGSDAALLQNGIRARSALNNSTVNIMGGSIDSRDDAMQFNGGLNTGSTVNVTNVDAEARGSGEAADFNGNIDAGATATFSGGSYVGGGSGIESNTIAGTLNIEDATVTGRHTTRGQGVNVLGNITGTLSVDNSTVTGGVSAVGRDSGSAYTNINGGTVNIKDSTLTGLNGDAIEFGGVTGEATVSITKNTIEGKKDGIVFKGDISNNLFRNEEEILIANNKKIVGGDNGISFEGESSNKTDIVIRDNKNIEGETGHGISHTGGLNNAELVVLDNKKIKGGQDGVHVEGDLKGSSTVEIRGNKNIRGVEDDGIHVADTKRTGGVDVDIIGNTNIHDTGDNGIQVSNINAVEIEENNVSKAGRNGIQVTGGTNHDIRKNEIRRVEHDGIRVTDFGNAWIAYNDIKWTGDDGIHAEDGEFVSIYDNYVDLAGYSKTRRGNKEVGKDANGIYVENVGGEDLPDILPEGTEEGFGYSKYGASVEIYGNDVANSQDDGIQVKRTQDNDETLAVVSNDEDDLFSAYIADNIVGHAGDDGVDVDGLDTTVVRDNAVSLVGDKGITIDGGYYAGVFDNTVLLTGNDGIQVENIRRRDGQVDPSLLGDSEYGYGWAVNVSGNQVAMTGDDGIEVRNSDATRVVRNDVFIAGVGEGLEEVIDRINTLANGTFDPRNLVTRTMSGDDYSNSFGWEWGDGHGINVHGIDGAYYSPNGWAADIRGNDVVFTGGHGINAENNDRTRIKNNYVRYAGVDYTYFYGAPSMTGLLNTGPFHSEGRRDLWQSTEGGMIDVLDGYFGAEQPEDDRDYITVEVSFDAHDGIHAQNIYGQSDDGLSGRSYLYDLKIKGNDVRITGDDGIEVNGAGRTLIAGNTIRDAGHGDDEDYGSEDYDGADGIHVRNVSTEIYNGRRQDLPGRDYRDGYEYESPRNYALIIRNNDVRRTADDGIEVVGNGEYQDQPDADVNVQSGRGDYPKERYGYGTTDRVLIAENTVRRSGDRSFKDSYGDGYGHDGIHVRGISGDRYETNDWISEETAVGGQSGSTGYGYYGYAVDVIGNDVRRSGDDGIEVRDSSSTLIDGNTVKRSGYNNSRRKGSRSGYDADGIHVSNVSNDRNGFPSVGFSGGEDFTPYSVVIRNNDVDRSGDDGVNVRNSGDTRVERNTVNRSGTRRGPGNSDGISIEAGFGGEIFSPASSFYPGIRSTNVEVVRNTVTNSQDDGIEVRGATDVLVRRNTVDNSGDDGINVRGFADLNIKKDDFESDLVDNIAIAQVTTQDGYYPYTPDFRVRIVNNDVTNSGTARPEETEGEFETQSFRTKYDFRRFGGDGIQVEGFDRIVVRNNEVTNSVDNGLYVSGANNGRVIVDGNTFTDNDIGAHFESGRIQLAATDGDGVARDGNTFNGGRVGLRFSPVEVKQRPTMTPLDDLAELVPPTPIFADMSLVNDTIGAQTFNGQSEFYVELDNGAFFNPGTPTILNGTQSNFDGIVPASQGNVLTPEQFAAINAKIFDFRDRNDLGLFFFGIAQNPFAANQEELFQDFDPADFAGGNVQVTILPGIGSNSGGAGAPTDPSSLNNINPAAGGELTPEELNNIESAAGGEGEEASCWGDAIGEGATTFSFGSTLDAAAIDAETSCGS